MRQTSAVTRSSDAKQKLILQITFCLLTLFLFVCLVGNYMQYQKVNTLMRQIAFLSQQNTTLKNTMQSLDSKLQSLSTQVQIIDDKAKKYLTLQGEVCSQTVDTCLDAVIARLETKPVLEVAAGGLCLVRGGGTSVPSSSDPDVGKGYAKLTKTGVNTLRMLQASCNQNDYAKLLQAYCSQNTNPASFEVAVVNTFGGVATTGCSSFGCGQVGCPKR